MHGLKMKVVVAGSRSITDYVLVEQAISSSGLVVTEIVSGGARGVDNLGEQYANSNDVNLKIFKADWSRYGKAAGPIRNGQMADYADAAVIVWDGKSSGTKNMIEQMKKRGKPVHVVMSVPAEQVGSGLVDFLED